MGGFQNWKEAHYSDGGLPEHARCEYHMTAMLAWAEYDKIRMSGARSVQQMRSEACAKIICEHRRYAKTVAEVLLLTATQNTAQRSHYKHSTDELMLIIISVTSGKSSA